MIVEQVIDELDGPEVMGTVIPRLLARLDDKALRTVVEEGQRLRESWKNQEQRARRPTLRLVKSEML